MFLIHTSPQHADVPGRRRRSRVRQTVTRGAACNTDLLFVVDFFQHANNPWRVRLGL